MSVLHLFSFNLPIKWADLSEKAKLHFALTMQSMRNGVKRNNRTSLEKGLGLGLVG